MEINFRKASFKALAASIDQCPDTDVPEVVMSGRSNVGIQMRFCDHCRKIECRKVLTYQCFGR